MADKFQDLGKHGGFVSGFALGTLAGAFTLAATGDAEAAGKVTYETSMPYGETQFDLAGGNTGAAKKSATIETASNVASAGGVLAGAAAGAALGSVVPIIGTAVGGVIGGIAGGLVSGVSAAYITEKVYDNFESIKGRALIVSTEAANSLNNAIASTHNLVSSLFDDRPELDKEAVYSALPAAAEDSLPPEINALVEAKASPDRFEALYEEFDAQGSLETVRDYLAGQSAANDENYQQDISPQADLPTSQLTQAAFAPKL